MDVKEAIQQLRAHLQESQQAFSNRLGLSLRAIAFYETGRVPAASVLVSLSKLALASGRTDLAKTLMLALAKELMLGQDDEGAMLSWETSKDKTTRTYVLIDVRRAELLDFLLALHETLGRYLNPKDDEMKARAKKLLAEFECGARKAWKGTRGSLLSGVPGETSLLFKERL
jgi:transcriptional regulator with XRE-family HTH domain